MAQKALYEDVIDEIGTQTLARFGLNIFSLNTYTAYGASVTATMDTARTYNKHKNNDKYYGYTFEELDIGKENMLNALQNNGNKSYTTDTLATIKKTQEILSSGKKLENLKPEDRAKVEHILTYYSDEVKNMNLEKLGNIVQGNHNTTDKVTIDKNGNIIKTEQLKVIKNTEGLLKDRYLLGDDAIDELKVPFDDYKRHKENLEKMIENGAKNPQNEKAVIKAQKAKIALEKLNANNTCNRLMAENPRTTAVITQSIAASGHIMQAGFSDAIVIALSTLASGIVWEIKDMFNGKIDSETSIIARIKRLLNKAIESFKNTFARGAIFGAIDVAIGIITQIFRNIASSLRQLWTAIRNSAKSIYNGIYSYVKGEIQNTRELLKTILKSLFSAAWIVGAIGLEKQLEANLLTIIPPLAPFVAPILAITASAFAVVITHRSIDLVLDSLFSVYASRDAAKLRAEEIANLVAERLPLLINKREQLEQLIESTHKKRLAVIEASFSDYQKAYANKDDCEIYNSLNSICCLYDKELQIKTINDVKNILQKEGRTGKLQW